MGVLQDINLKMSNYIEKNDLSYLLLPDECSLLFNGITEEEANHNFEMITFSKKQLKNITANDLIFFLKKIILIRKNIILDNKIKNINFYLWHDLLAGNLRFSCITGVKFPFGCKLHLLNSLDSIVTSYKNNPGGFILKSELEYIAPNEIEEGTKEDNTDYILDVYVEKLS